MVQLVLAALVLGTVVLSSVAVADLRDPLCRLLLHEEQREREDLEIQLRLARSELAAREEIMVLLEGLWKIQGVERLLYVTGKHDRDLAKIEVERRRLLVEAQEAFLEQYRAYCAALSSGKPPTAERLGVIDPIWERYLRADCDAIGQERSAAEVDLEYEREVLASVLDLRESDVATRQDVILAELDVRTAEERVAHARGRAERCRAEVPATTGSPPPRP